MTRTSVRGLASVLASAIVLVNLSSCTSQSDFIDTPRSVRVSFSGFGITSAPMTRGETTPIPGNLNRLSLSVFDAQGTAVSSSTQKRGDAGFGTATFTLAPGDYTFVCVINEAVATASKPLADIAPATISSPDVATIPGTAAHDTYCCSQTVTVTSSTTDVRLDMGSRINARFTLRVTDTWVPQDVRSVAFTIGTEGNTSYTSIELDPSTGLTSSPYIFSGKKTLADGATEVPEISMDLYLPEQSYTTTVTLAGRDGASPANVLYTRTIDDVQFAPNQHVTATGRLFDPATPSATFTFGTTTWTQSEVTF